MKIKAADALAAIDPSDPQTELALARLREQCTLAKEVLSQEHSAIVPVVLPGSTGTVVIQRQEFESAIEDLVEQTVDALERSLHSAGLNDGSDVDSVLLVGGSSRVPMVSTLLADRLGVPVLVDTHPKQAVVLGACRATVPRARSAVPITVETEASLDTVSSEPTVLPPMTVTIAEVQAAVEERYLLALNGPLSGTTVEITTEPSIVGRITGNGVIGLNDSRISRRHLQVHRTDEGVVLTDLDSTNGTWVDGRQITGEHVVEPGSIIELGSTLLLLESPFFALPAPEMLASSWSMPPLVLQTGLSGRLANRKAGGEWLASTAEHFADLGDMVDRVRRSRRMFRPNGPRTVGWVKHAPDRVFPRSTDDDYYGSVTLGHGPSPTLFDFTPPKGLRSGDRDSLAERIGAYGVDPWVPIPLSLLGAETTIGLPTRDAKALLRSMLYEFVHFHPREPLVLFGIDPAVSEWEFLNVGSPVVGEPGASAYEGLVISYGPGRVAAVGVSGRGTEVGSAGTLRVGELPGSLAANQAVIVPTDDDGVFQLVHGGSPALNFIPATLPAGRVPTTKPTP